jgi:hypothetical protein
MEANMSNTPDGPKIGAPGMLGMFFDRYGSWAFGLGSVILLNMFILKPQVDRMTIDFDKHQKIVEKMHDLISTQNELCSTLAKTAIVLESAAGKINALQIRP